MTNVARHYLFDLSTGALTRVRQPGLGYESLTHLSDRHSRILGTGPRPFQITPDGTCIRLDALRIRNTLTDSPEPFGSPPSAPSPPPISPPTATPPSPPPTGKAATSSSV